jgi:Uma2 family endonuclease
MAKPAGKLRVTFAEYLAGELSSDRKHQLVDGEVFDMTGGTPVHAALILAVGSELRQQLRGRPCRPFGSDLRVRAGDLATYPDCTVVCGELEVDPEDANTVLNPTVIVEVLSDGTEAFDRGRKAEQYRRVASLRELVLVGQHQPHLEVYRRTERGWIFLEAGKGGRLELESIGCQLEVDSIFEGI